MAESRLRRIFGWIDRKLLKIFYRPPEQRMDRRCLLLPATPAAATPSPTRSNLKAAHGTPSHGAPARDHAHEGVVLVGRDHEARVGGLTREHRERHRGPRPGGRHGDDLRRQ